MNKKKADETKAAETEKTTLGERITALFDLPGLSAVRGPLEPVLDFLEENEYAAYGVVATAGGLGLFIILSLIPRVGPVQPGFLLRFTNLIG